MFRFDLTADVRPLFNWNVKQVNIYLSAEYTTKQNTVNQVVIWDTTIGRWELTENPSKIGKMELAWKRSNIFHDVKDLIFGKQIRKLDKVLPKPVYHKNGVIEMKNQPNKYVLADDGNSLRGNEVTFRLNWQITPRVGFLFDQDQLVGSYELPQRYKSLDPDSRWAYRTTDE